MELKGYEFSSSPDLIINVSTKSREDIYISQSYNLVLVGMHIHLLRRIDQVQELLVYYT